MGNGATTNVALEFIRQNFSSHAKVPHLLNIFPELASHFWEYADKMSSTILLDQDITDGPRELLAKCILDLELVSGFGPLLEFTRNKELASCYIDALVIELTDEIPGDTPSELDYMALGTCRHRGILKYSRAGNHLKMADTEGWIFAKEYALIVSDSSDILYIMGALPISLRIRFAAKWKMELALTGRVPTPEEQKKAEDLYRKLIENRDRTFEEMMSLHESSKPTTSEETGSEDNPVFKGPRFENLLAKAEAHQRQFRPEETRRLEAKGQLMSVLRERTLSCWETLKAARQNGANLIEAEEVALPLILLPDEKDENESS